LDRASAQRWRLEALPAHPIPIGTAQSTAPLAALFKLADACTLTTAASPPGGRAGGRHAEDTQDASSGCACAAGALTTRAGSIIRRPQDWDDVQIISTGFEKTRRELEPVIPALKDAGLPCELTLAWTRATLSTRPCSKCKRNSASSAPFSAWNFHRTRRAALQGTRGRGRQLWQTVLAAPVTLLVGDSGVGKTSLIHAGLEPQLHTMRCARSMRVL